MNITQNMEKFRAKQDARAAKRMSISIHGEAYPFPGHLTFGELEQIKQHYGIDPTALMSALAFIAWRRSQPRPLRQGDRYVTDEEIVSMVRESETITIQDAKLDKQQKRAREEYHAKSYAHAVKLDKQDAKRLKRRKRK